MFRAIQHLGDIAEREMFRTFNMGIGFVLVVPETSAETAVDESCSERRASRSLLGEITPGKEQGHAGRALCPAEAGLMFKLAVLASGSGTNLQAIIDKLHRRERGSRTPGTAKSPLPSRSRSW